VLVVAVSLLFSPFWLSINFYTTKIKIIKIIIINSQIKRPSEHQTDADCETVQPLSDRYYQTPDHGTGQNITVTEYCHGTALLVKLYNCSICL